jgi:hypothetical protein
MKKVILAIALIGCIWTDVFSQSTSSQVESKLERYFQATQNKDWNQVMDMINPRIFNFAPRELMVQLYSQMESDAGMDMKFTEMEILHIKKGINLRDTTYMPVDYKMTLLIQLHPSRYQNADELQSMLAGFELAYAGQEINFDEASKKFTIRVRNTLIASSKLNSDTWFFGEYKPSDPITKLIFPLEILKKLEQGWN